MACGKDTASEACGRPAGAHRRTGGGGAVLLLLGLDTRTRMG
jgi:hypothetical protein